MAGPLHQYLAADHDRLDDLLRRATARPGAIDAEAYAEFRKGIVRHIGIEEKIMLPAISRARGGTPAEDAERMRLDHGALVALLVPPPSPFILATLRSILPNHNVLEEREDGVYDLFDTLMGSETDSMLERLRSAPEVPVLPHNARPEILEATRRALQRAGYTLQDGTA